MYKFLQEKAMEQNGFDNQGMEQNNRVILYIFQHIYLVQLFLHLA
jgi:hypothetical protein